MTSPTGQGMNCHIQLGFHQRSEVSGEWLESMAIGDIHYVLLLSFCSESSFCGCVLSCHGWCDSLLHKNWNILVCTCVPRASVCVCVFTGQLNGEAVDIQCIPRIYFEYFCQHGNRGYRLELLHCYSWGCHYKAIPTTITRAVRPSVSASVQSPRTAPSYILLPNLRGLIGGYVG